MKKLIFLLLFPVLVSAEPGPATQYLMNEPASLFDVGMVRLQHLIGYEEKQIESNYRSQSMSDSVFDADVNAYYRPEDDKIYVDLSVMDLSATEEQMEAGCRSILFSMRILVGKNLHKLFQHVGEGFLSDSLSGLGDMFELRCHVYDSSASRFWATRTLRSEEMTIGKWSASN